MTIGRRSKQFLTWSFRLGVGALIAATVTPCSGSAASQLRVLYSFCATGGGDYCTDGEYPEAGLIRDTSGNFYGTTESGGADGAGTVFELTPNKTTTGWVHKVLYRFCAQGGGNCTDGAYPEAGLIRDASGRLYGTTYQGGAVGDGTVFMLTPPAAGKTLWTEKVLYSFCQQADCTDGQRPEAGLIEDASGNLYGTTYNGGTDGYYGAVFELTPPAPGQTAWTEIVLYGFCQQADCTDGYNPEAGLIRDALTGNLYGTTYYGGANGEGTVFELTPPATGQSAWTESVLYSFCQQADCADGEQPRAHLIRDPSGKLYGTTSEGGAYNGGTVFALTPPAGGQSSWTEILLHSFCTHGGRDCTDGGYPAANLIRDASGNLYGTTDYGGTDGGGTVFELTPNKVGTAWTESVLYSFCSKGDRDCTDGSYPDAGLLRDASGNIYGTTSEGGANGGPYGYDGGTVFELVKRP
jgi:uncharacterized repeat protein (TIGR03803 family)